MQRDEAILWRKSSYSQGQGTCVEVGWRKSSYSPHNDNCVEVGVGFDAVGIRDTKDRDGGHLAVTPARWQAFLRAVKDGALDA
ncbi:DUF397 domain-containing protein [Saccharopolyspora sp. ASAGF58]|uniref:DUF397 domain-containing protein n=1 Tax=Saccharopolyspora sp. ASAGF58 TaxID=2719023 RepID=UPI001440018F|nr:DUF397 domain-containing protein [Saccharopolyspora sp. ASAGF58]QIZ35890.1 DUF397 domain-containing protein [Saccharopolyspora sp. ASAGF58]